MEEKILSCGIRRGFIHYVFWNIKVFWFWHQERLSCIWNQIYIVTKSLIHTIILQISKLHCSLCIHSHCEFGAKQLKSLIIQWFFFFLCDWRWSWRESRLFWQLYYCGKKWHEANQSSDTITNASDIENVKKRTLCIPLSFERH